MSLQVSFWKIPATIISATFIPPVKFGCSGNVELSLSLIKHYDMRKLGDWRYSSTILGLDASWKREVSCPTRPLYPWEIAPGAHWIGRWVNCKDGLDSVEKGNTCPCLE
jgi:hypothetical protein